MDRYGNSLDSDLSLRKILTTVGTAFLVLVVLIAGSKTFENNDASEIMVVQAPLSGKFTIYKTPGMKWQGWGSVTKYKKREQFWFSDDSKEGNDEDGSLPITFNDGGTAHISGSVAWEMPMVDSVIIQLHSKYHGAEAIDQQLIKTVVAKSVFLAGPLMSSTESYSIKRNDLISLISDQTNFGVYKTDNHEERGKDAMTGQDKTYRVVKLIPSAVPAERGFARQEVSPLEEFGIRAFNLSINNVKYDDKVAAQIAEQQQATMQVQTAMTEAKKAEQAAITAEKNGQAAAAKAKWEQEVIKAKEVTSAEQRKAVAKLDADAAEFRKQANILDGEGEARKRQLVMSADGALDKKLEAWVKAQGMWADAVKGYQGNWVPAVVMGNASNGAAGSGANGLIDMLMAKTANDLSLDFRAGLRGNGQSAKK